MLGVRPQGLGGYDEMKSFGKKQGVFLISAIMAIVATALFFVVPITVTFIISYIFAILGIAMLFFVNLYMLSNPKSYPWVAALPMAILQYMTAQTALSATFVIREIFFVSTFHLGLFVFLHILLLGIFSVRLILLKGGKEIIEGRDSEVKQKVSVMRLMQNDVESVMRQHPQYDKLLKQVVEALRYSDPMSNPSVGIYEEQIQRSIFAMKELESNELAKIPEICESLLRQIAERNNRAKLMK